MLQLFRSVGLTKDSKPLMCVNSEFTHTSASLNQPHGPIVLEIGSEVLECGPNSGSVGLENSAVFRLS